MGNQLVHFEIPADDPDRARTFYQNLFDWKITKARNFDYWLIDTGEGPGVDGGLVKKLDKSQPLVNYVHVESLTKATERAKVLGADVLLERQEVPGRGAFAVIRDPDGNALGLWENA